MRFAKCHRDAVMDNTSERLRQLLRKHMNFMLRGQLFDDANRISLGPTPAASEDPAEHRHLQALFCSRRIHERLPSS